MTMTSKNRWLATTLIAILVAALLGYILAGTILPPLRRDPPPIPPEIMTILVSLKTMLSFMNLVLVASLLVAYVGLYRSIKSKFTSGLMLTIFVLGLYALFSNPLLHVLFGYYTEGLGPFTILPDVFATVALLVLLDISLE
jgi:small-conductance mechanosensitive channel